VNNDINNGIHYIVCSAKADGGNKCDGYAKPEDSCSVGKLNYHGSNYELCIDASNSVSISNASYLVDAMDDSTFVHEDNVPEAGQYYVLVNINSGNIILNAQGNY